MDSDSDDIEEPQVASNIEHLKQSQRSEIRMEDLSNHDPSPLLTNETPLEKSLNEQTEADMKRLMELKEQYLKTTFQVQQPPLIVEDMHNDSDLARSRNERQNIDIASQEEEDEASFALTTSHFTAVGNNAYRSTGLKSTIKT